MIDEESILEQLIGNEVFVSRISDRVDTKFGLPVQYIGKLIKVNDKYALEGGHRWGEPDKKSTIYLEFGDSIELSIIIK